jgi:phage minor structural protein
LRLFPSVDQNKSSVISSRESSNPPKVTVTYSNADTVNEILISEATKYMYEWHIPIRAYRVRYADLSKAPVGTWSGETVSLGDTVKSQDKDLVVNEEVRVKKIVEDILNPKNTQIELANKAYNLIDLLVPIHKKLKRIAPYANKPNIIDSSAIKYAV